MKRLVQVAMWITVCACAEAAYGQNADFRWREFEDAGAHAVSADGRVIFGEAEVVNSFSPDANSITDAPFVWRGDGDIEFLPKPPHQHCWAYGVSGNGRVFVGSLNSRAYRWTYGDDEIEPLLASKSRTSYATAASYDGSTIVGMFRKETGGYQGFRWSRENGVQPIAGPRGRGETFIYDVSNDGNVVVGSYRETNGKIYPFRWSRERGAESLGSVRDSRRLDSDALGVSPDGRVVVGVEEYGPRDSRAWYWTRSTGLRLLNAEGFRLSRALATNHDGSVIVGSLGGRAAVWLNGEPILLRPMLHDAGIDMSNFPLHYASDCSRSGRIVVGGGDPDIAFRAVLPLPNHAPIAVAGKNANVRPDNERGAWVELDGGRSFDQDEDALRFRWTAPKVRFEDRNARRTRAYFPLGTTEVTLVVKDEGDLEDSDTIRITVKRGARESEADLDLD